MCYDYKLRKKLGKGFLRSEVGLGHVTRTRFHALRGNVYRFTPSLHTNLQ